MGKGIKWRGGLALCLLGALLLTNLGCHPAGSSTPASSANKPGEAQTPNKGGPHKPDIGD
jgi:hypothetical protein